MKTNLIVLLICSGVFAQTPGIVEDTSSTQTGTETNRAAITTQAPPTQAASTQAASTQAASTQAASTQAASQLFHPVTFDTSGIGSLSISTYPEKTEVFVNGQFVGKGDQLLTNMKTGMYCVNLKYESETQENYVLVQNSKLASLAGSLGRTSWFVVEPSFSRFFLAGKNSFGPALDLGIQHKNLYYGIDYSWNFGNWSDLYMFGGSAFKFRYCFNFKDIISISPGMMAGFWYAEYSISNTADSYGYYYDDSNTEFFFGGICCRANFGYKSVFFQIDDAILFGTSVSNSLKIGMSIKI